VGHSPLLGALLGTVLEPSYYNYCPVWRSRARRPLLLIL